MPNQKYLCIQRSKDGRCEQPSPADMEKMYAAFMAWMEKYKENLVDVGGMLASGGKVVSAEGAIDGPFVEAKEIIGGYMVISAETMEKAVEVVRESPGVAMPGSSVEIRAISTP